MASQNVVYGTNFNPLNVFVPGVYIQVIPPQSFFGGVPSSVAAVIGTADWGPLNSPVALSSPVNITANFGGVSAASLTDVHDLCTDLVQGLSQAGVVSGLIVYGVRVDDGTSVKAHVTLNDLSMSPVAALPITARYSGTKGNSIQIIVAANLSNATTSVTVVPFAGGGAVEYYTGLPTDLSFFPALANAINNGQGPARPPSVLVSAGAVTPATLGPAVGTFALASGTSGRGVTSSNLIGSNTAPTSGLYTLQNVQFTPSVVWIAGLTDTTVWATFQAFCDANNIFGLLTFAANVTTAAAVTAKASAGIADYQVGFVKDWVWFYDQANAQSRLIPPLATAGGTIATLPPWASPLNKPVSNIIGTERNNQFTGNVPYSYAELASLGQAGIMLITNPIGRGAVYGFQNGYNSVGNNLATAYVEYSRLTNFLVNTNGGILGQFLGELQGFTAADPLRAQIKSAVNSFLQQLQANNYIGAFNVQCDLNNNSNISIAQHEVVLFQTIQYLSSVYTIFDSIQGGTTVNAVSNQLGPNFS